MNPIKLGTYSWIMSRGMALEERIPGQEPMNIDPQGAIEEANNGIANRQNSNSCFIFGGKFWMGTYRHRFLGVHRRRELEGKIDQFPSYPCSGLRLPFH